MGKLIDVVRAYLKGIEQGNLEAVLSCYAPDAVQVEWPNRLKGKGDRRAIGQLSVDFDKGKGLLAKQSYEILHAVESEGYAVVEVLWTGTLAVAVGKLAAGADMVAHSSIGFDFKDELIISQRNYDCFEEF